MHAARQSVFSGLGSDTYIVGTAGPYQIVAKTTDLPPSGLTLTIAQTGSVSLSTSVTSGNVQNHIECNLKMNCAAGDTLTVTLASSAAADQPPNMIKTTIDLKQGAY